MHHLSPECYVAAQPLFAPLGNHLAVAAVLAGDAAGQVYADDSQHPGVALALAGRRFHLAGVAGDEAYASCTQFFEDTLCPQVIASGMQVFVVYCASPAWHGKLDGLLPNSRIVRVEREYYEHTGQLPAGVPDPPPGFELRDVDASLLGDESLAGRGWLAEEMTSERPSIEDFLRRSFGQCLVHDGAIAGWCLSEYNCGPRCEVGIAVAEPYQRRGLATSMAIAFLRQAHDHGIERVGWHCAAQNVPSGRTAMKATFRKVADYEAAVVWPAST